MVLSFMYGPAQGTIGNAAIGFDEPVAVFMFGGCWGRCASSGPICLGPLNHRTRGYG